MNTASYFLPIPPCEWLVYALLVYDKINIDIDETDLELIRLMPNTPKLAIDSQKLLQVLNSGLVGAAIELGKPKVDRGPSEEYLDSLDARTLALGLADFVSGYTSTDPEICAVRSLMEDHYIKEASTLFHHDIYLPWSSPFVSLVDSDPALTLYAVQQVVPIEPEKIEPAQILDFREANKFTRIELLKASEAIISDIKSYSTEADTKRITNDLADHMRHQLQRVRRQYRDCNINTGSKVISSVAPAGLGVLSLVGTIFHLPVESSGSMIAAVAIKLLDPAFDRASALETLRNDKWAFLWNLDNTVK